MRTRHLVRPGEAQNRTEDAAVARLVGAGIGALATLGASLSTERSRARSERESRQASDQRIVRDLCAGAYVDAAEAVLWLSTTFVEDSIDPQFAEELGPPTARALERARGAREALGKASALGTSPASVLSGRAAVALGALVDAWCDAQSYKRKLTAKPLAGNSKKMEEFYNRQFYDAFARLLAARQRLSGFDGTELDRDAIAEGGARPGSLLELLRLATTTQV